MARVTAALPEQAAQELQTLRDILRWAVTLFNTHGLQFGQGTDNAWDEAVYLALAGLSLPIDSLTPFLDARLTLDERKQLCHLMQQRVEQRLPAAYLFGEAWLQGYRFRVSPDCIIPRSPIAELLVEQLQPWVDDPSRPQAILDLCTGSGCLAILAALYFPQAQVDAVDISPAALKIAHRNVSDYSLEQQVHLIESNLFDQIPSRRYDIIICNPPYVNAQSMAQLPDEFLHEPALALAGGTDGMDYVRRILTAAPNYLADGGFIILEVGNEYANFVQAFPQLEPTWLSTAAADEQILLLYKEQLSL